MGLYLPEIKLAFSYSGFNRFRTHLAKAAGISLLGMEGFGGDISWDDVDTPLKPFLDHSDCDGILTWKECGAVYPTLRKICRQWYESKDADRPDVDFILAGFKIAAGMARCFEQEQDLHFT